MFWKTRSRRIFLVGPAPRVLNLWEDQNGQLHSNVDLEDVHVHTCTVAVQQQIEKVQLYLTLVQRILFACLSSGLKGVCKVFRGNL